MAQPVKFKNKTLRFDKIKHANNDPWHSQKTSNQKKKKKKKNHNQVLNGCSVTIRTLLEENKKVPARNILLLCELC
jgi:hypothetical protein